MALINCPECKKEVSDTSHKCPHCGFVIKNIERSKIGKTFLSLFILSNICMIVLLIMFLMGKIGVMSDGSGNEWMKGMGILLFFYMIVPFPLGILSYFTRAK